MWRGTTKVSVIDVGRIHGTSALNIGARLLAHDEAETLTRAGESRTAFSRRPWVRSQSWSESAGRFALASGYPDGSCTI